MKFWSKEDIEYLKLNYPEVEKEKICNRLSRTWTAIISKAHKLGIKRNVGKFISLRMQPDLKRNYFKTWSPNMAYILGWIYSDGCIGQWGKGKIGKLSIGLQSRDDYILKWMRDELGGGAMHHQQGHGNVQDQTCLCISSHEIYKDLTSLGLHPAKSYTITFPDVPKQYLPDFIRGFFDGDGSVLESGSSPRVQITSASPAFLDKFEEIMIEEVGIKMQRTEKDKNTNKAEDSRCHGADALTFYDFIYYKGCMHLKRKKKKFEQLEKKYPRLRIFQRNEEWLGEEDKIIKKYYAGLGYKKTQKLLPLRAGKKIRRRASQLGVKMKIEFDRDRLANGDNQFWSNKEIDFLKNNYLHMKDIEIAEHLNRTHASVINMRIRLNLNKDKAITNKVFSKEEIEFIRKNYKTMSTKEISEKINKDENQIRDKANYLGLIKTSNHKFWTEEEVDYLMNNYQKEEKDILIDKLERNWGAIVKKANSLGITRKKVN